VCHDFLAIDDEQCNVGQNGHAIDETVFPLANLEEKGWHAGGVEADRLSAKYFFGI
jgi:hypothetical protein